ncbi:MAG: hypothetical protein RJA36_2638, partial [Pseudomonadota bacterium]
MTRSLTTTQAIRAHSIQAAVYGATRDLREGLDITGLYSAHFWMPKPARLDEYIALRDTLSSLMESPVVRASSLAEIEAIRARLAAIQQELVWEDRFSNLVTTEGKNAVLTHFLKGSSYTAAQVLGLIEDTGYTAVAVGNTAASITAVGGGSPANGWNEAPVGTVSVRQTPSFGTAGSGSLAATATSHSTLATDTIKGAFLMARSTAGTAPTTAVGNTSGAL